MQTNKFWSTVLAAVLGAVLSAGALAAFGALLPLGVQLILPGDAVIPMAGECPRGWQHYGAEAGEYLTAAPGQPVNPSQRAQQIAPTARGKIVLPQASTYIVLTLCQRR